MNRHQIFLGAISCVLCCAANLPSFAQDLFRDEMTSGAGWGMNASSADTSATFGYDYSTDGIPEAPNSRGGDAATTGVKLEANIADPGTLEVFTLYPTGKNFTGNYKLRFDAWMNYDADERVNGGSNGTTEFLGGGLGYDNVAADIGSGAQVLATGDGGSGSDWRAFKSPPAFFVAAADMAGGSRDGGADYYSDFLPGVAPPAAQAQTAFPTGIAGSPGFQWITYELSVINDLVNIVVEKPGGDRLAIATLDCSDTSDGSSGCTIDGNISLTYADFFTSVTPKPNLTFGIIDNVQVTIPEPSAAGFVAIALMSLVWSRRTKPHLAR